jgi:hypothetical protein
MLVKNPGKYEVYWYGETYMEKKDTKQPEEKQKERIERTRSNKA